MGFILEPEEMKFRLKPRKDKKLFISLYTDRYIFPTPQKPEDIDQLSLVSEYHKLCRELALIKEITAIFEGEAS